MDVILAFLIDIIFAMTHLANVSLIRPWGHGKYQLIATSISGKWLVRIEEDEWVFSLLHCMALAVEC